jgi:uncharacterized membrane protein YoaK (UPF0700 family)
MSASTVLSFAAGVALGTLMTVELIPLALGGVVAMGTAVALAIRAAMQLPLRDYATRNSVHSGSTTTSRK